MDRLVGGSYWSTRGGRKFYVEEKELDAARWRSHRDFLLQYIPIVMREGIGQLVVDNGKAVNLVRLNSEHI